MKSRKIDSVYVIRLECGDKIIEKLIEFCKAEGVNAGYFNGLGAVTEAELGHFNLETKDYSAKMFQGPYEITSLHGSVSVLDGKPFIHAHLTMGDRQFVTYSGHLREGTAGATCEIFLVPLTVVIQRKLDEKTGLNLFDI